MLHIRVQRAEELRPDPLPLDVRLPGMTGVAVAGALAAAMPELRILVLSAHGGDEHVATLLRLGVRGYLTKSTTPVGLVSAIRSVDAGNVAFEATIARRLLGRAGLTPLPRPTEREAAVLRLVGEGLRNRGIASRLGIAEATVEFHLRNQLRKFAAGSCTEPVSRARQHGWVA